MKSIRTLAFILTIILVLGAGWFFFPAEGSASRRMPKTANLPKRKSMSTMC